MATSKSTIRRFYQRVLLFRHACTCKAPEGQCKVNSNCDKTKRLVKHVEVCKKKDCPIPHCNSSRSIMHHYVGCEDLKCPLCASVRKNKTRKSHCPTIRSPPSTHAKIVSLAIFSVSIPPNSTQLESTISPDPLHYFWDNDIKSYPSCPVVNLISSTSGRKRALSSKVSTEKRHLQKRIKIQPNVSVNPTVEIKSHTALEIKRYSAKDLPLQPNIPLVSAFVSVMPTANPVPKVLSKRELGKFHMNLTCKIRSGHKDFKDKCLIILQVLQSQSNWWLFANPVDPVECKIPDYFDVIKKPMDLGTILKKVDSGEYASIEDFKADVCLTFDNAIMYNAEDSIVHPSAIELKIKFLSEYNRTMDEMSIFYSSMNI